MQDNAGIVKELAEEGVTVSPRALEAILKSGLDSQSILSQAKKRGVWYMDEGFVDEFLLEEKDGVGDPASRCGPADMESMFELDTGSDVSGKSTCSGDVTDFVKYFNERYCRIRKSLMERVEYSDSTPIEGMRESSGDVKIVAMVSDKTTTSQNNLLMTVEDPSGEVTVYVNQGDERIQGLYEKTLVDDVVGIRGIYRRGLLIANDITHPDIPVNRTANRSAEEVYAAFMSDIHVGSYLFLHEEFQRFLDWVNGKGNHERISGRLKYICVAGDLVDGIGIYPGQERELTIPDIYKQYDFLGLLLEQVPCDIEIILGVGNHDAVRLAEPQPRIPDDLCPRLAGMENVTLVGSPARFKLHGVDVLMYHGNSLDSVIKNVPGASYREPQTPMTEFLKRRSLSPQYGSVGIAPEEKDYLFIDNPPDILHCGHVHTNGYGRYRGVNVINSGTWQGKTRYQEELGHQPTPARVPVVNLKTHDLTVLDFNSK